MGVLLERRDRNVWGKIIWNNEKILGKWLINRKKESIVWFYFYGMNFWYFFEGVFEIVWWVILLFYRGVFGK